MTLFESWQFIVYVCIFRAIKNKPDDELENAWPETEHDTTDTLPRASA
jgi:hypothetical protein